MYSAVVKRLKDRNGMKLHLRGDKLFLEQPSPEPKVQVLIPMHEPLEVSKCKKCRKVIAEPEELIGIAKKPK